MIIIYHGDDDNASNDSNSNDYRKSCDTTDIINKATMITIRVKGESKLSSVAAPIRETEKNGSRNVSGRQN